MKIKSMYVREYRVLRDFTLDLEQVMPPFSSENDYKLDLIVGVNGTGKSTLLRLLAELFQRLDSSQQPDFGFSIVYELKATDADGQAAAPLVIKITNRDEDEGRAARLEAWERKENAPRLYIHVQQGQQTIYDDLVDNIDKNYLPGRVVAFTSGREQDWELADTPYRENGISLDTLPDFTQTDQLEGWSEQTGHVESTPIEDERAFSDKRFLLIKSQFQPLLILCGLLADMKLSPPATPGQSPRLIFPLLAPAFEEVKLKQLAGFSLRLLPASALPGQESDFVQGLIKAATLVLRQGEERLLVFDLLDFAAPPERGSTLKCLGELIDSQGSGLATFQRLSSLQYPSTISKHLLREISLFLQRDYHMSVEDEEMTEREHPPLHTLEWFSDGEISFLSRLCLISLLRSEEALVLLDEPEVHFNDYWKRQLVNLLDRCLHPQQSHVLMTTHSSITLSDVENTSIRVLTRTVNETSSAFPPSIRTLGADPSDIITHVFGARSASGVRGNDYIQRQIQRIYFLTDTDQERERKKKREQLEQLLDIIGSSPWRYLIYREISALEGTQRM